MDENHETMSKQIPKIMRAIAIPKYSKPKDYDIATVPVPQISRPDELLIKVHAASMNPLDVKLASGLAKMLGLTPSFPYTIGSDLAGTIVKTGSSVTRFKPGDQVYSRLPNHLTGSMAQYALSSEARTALKPETLPFSEAAAMPLAAQAALQLFHEADRLIPGGLKGKTVFVPGGLGGTGSYALQLAKNVFGAGKVITTVSTKKVPLLEIYLGKGVVDQVIDYTKEKDVATAVGKGSVDFMFDPVGQTFSLLSVMKKGGMVRSIGTIGSGDQLAKEAWPSMPGYMRYPLNVVDWLIRLWTGWNGVHYRYFVVFEKRETLEELAKLVDQGKVKPVVGERIKLSDVEGIRRVCSWLLDGKGMVGKVVFEIDE